MLDMVTGATEQEWNEAPFTDGTIQALYAAFVSEHERLYGHRSDKDNQMQVIGMRMVGKAYVGGGQVDMNVRAPGTSANGKHTRRAYFGDRVGIVDTPVLSRAALDGTLQGPLLIDEYDSTTVVPPEASVTRDGFNNIVMEFA
jgi:N-methylhydantoinase A